jgi:hypothetical protein
MSRSTQVDYILEMNPKPGRFPHVFLKPVDIAILLMIGTASLASVRYLPLPGRASVCDVYVDGIRTRIIPVGAGALLRDTITTRNGRVVVETGKGSFCVVQSSCPNKNCVHAGGISRSGQSIICVPNRFVAVIRAPDGDLDGMAR